MDEMRTVFVVAPAPATEFDEALAAAGAVIVGRSDPDPILAVPAVTGAGPESVLVDLDWPMQDSLEVIAGLLEAEPSIPVVAATSMPRSAEIAQLLESSLVTVLEKPLQWTEFQRASARRSNGVALEPVTEEEVAEREAGRVIAVAGAKGGIGRTAIATNLAVSLAESQSGSVALVDFDLEFGDVALAMDLVPDFSLVDLPAQMERLDPLLLGQYMTLHRSGVRLLAAPMRPGQERRFTARHAVAVLRLMKQMFDYVVADLPRGLGPIPAAVLGMTDEVVFVTEPQLAGIKNSRLALHVLRSWRSESNDLRVVLNRNTPKSQAVKSEVESALGMEISAEFPFEKKLTEAWLAGKTLREVAPKSRLVKAVDKLARQIAPPAGWQTEQPSIMQRFRKSEPEESRSLERVVLQASGGETRG